ncbi:RNA-binding protein 33-like [Thalassophryne amazonica]|uniref:RNA-binding protein 33-like n=1 Tax=Thalassophryne amazonica TaxID=390379 RepID=UPI0014712453|nr:RNA-binding protein 33-like [Thalassophryne amazonica]
MPPDSQAPSAASKAPQAPPPRIPPQPPKPKTKKPPEQDPSHGDHDPPSTQQPPAAHCQHPRPTATIHPHNRPQDPGLHRPIAGPGDHGRTGKGVTREDQLQAAGGGRGVARGGGHPHQPHRAPSPTAVPAEVPWKPRDGGGGQPRRSTRGQGGANQQGGQGARAPQMDGPPHTEVPEQGKVQDETPAQQGQPRSRGETGGPHKPRQRGPGTEGHAVPSPREKHHPPPRHWTPSHQR